jgi:hypothetical protein
MISTRRLSIKCNAVPTSHMTLSVGTDLSMITRLAELSAFWTQSLQRASGTVYASDEGP